MKTILLLAVLGLVGCATSVERDEFEVAAEDEERLFASIREVMVNSRHEVMLLADPVKPLPKKFCVRCSSKKKT